MNATLIKEASALKARIYDEILRELQLGVRKGGGASLLNAEQREALYSEYDAISSVSLLKATDEQISTMIAALEAFQQKATAALNEAEKPVQAPGFVELIDAMETAGFTVSQYIREPGDTDLRAAQLVSELNDQLTGYDVAVINTLGAQVRYLTPTHPILREFFAETTQEQWHTLTPLGKFVYDHMPSMA